MEIDKNHFLSTAKKMLLPGGSPMEIRRAVVIHFTGGWSGASSVEWWKNPAAQGANAHIVIDRDGSIIQCRPFNRTAGHAGKQSAWTDSRTGITYRNSQVNACTIGIELANCGDLQRSHYPAGLGLITGQAIPRLTARHKNGGPATLWERYPTTQTDACREVCKALCLKYNLDDCVGHDDVAPARKNDPGPAFPMKELRLYLGFPK